MPLDMAQGCALLDRSTQLRYMRSGTLHKGVLQGFRRMNPFCIPFAIINMSGALLAMDVGFMGPKYSISTACATGNYCILR